jgi:hypothetical protein
MIDQFCFISAEGEEGNKLGVSSFLSRSELYSDCTLYLMLCREQTCFHAAQRKIWHQNFIIILTINLRQKLFKTFFSAKLITHSLRKRKRRGWKISTRNQIPVKWQLFKL